MVLLLFNLLVWPGVRAQVATIEQHSAEAVQKAEAPIVIITGASRGIGKAIALALGKAGCKVYSESYQQSRVPFWIHTSRP